MHPAAGFADHSHLFASVKPPPSRSERLVLDGSEKRDSQRELLHVECRKSGTFLACLTNRALHGGLECTWWSSLTDYALLLLYSIADSTSQFVPGSRRRKV